MQENSQRLFQGGEEYPNKKLGPNIVIIVVENNHIQIFGSVEDAMSFIIVIKTVKKILGET